jgi:hypothetical protein
VRATSPILDNRLFVERISLTEIKSLSTASTTNESDKPLQHRTGRWPTQLWVAHSIAFCAIEWDYSTADISKLRKQKSPALASGALRFSRARSSKLVARSYLSTCLPCRRRVRPGIGAPFLSSGISETSASVVSISDAIDPALVSAVRTAFVELRNHRIPRRP